MAAANSVSSITTVTGIVGSHHRRGAEQGQNQPLVLVGTWCCARSPASSSSSSPARP
ncbi:MAG: hypothetical protein ACLSVD_12370 [Eggerthellaceae bacterium]